MGGLRQKFEAFGFRGKDVVAGAGRSKYELCPYLELLAHAPRGWKNSTGNKLLPVGFGLHMRLLLRLSELCQMKTLKARWVWSVSPPVIGV